MNKTLILFCVLGCLLVSCKQNYLSNSYWLAVKSSRIQSEQGFSGYDGMTVHFNNNKITLGSIYDEHNSEYEMKSNGTNIFVDDTLWAVKFAEYGDSLLIDVPETNTRIKLVKLGEDDTSDERPELWQHGNWILSHDNLDRELYLTDSIFFDDSTSKILIQKDLKTNQFNGRADKWNYTSINGNKLFAMTFNQWFDEFYRVKQYIGDSIIELEPLQNPKVASRLSKKQHITDSEVKGVFDLVQNHTWQIEKIIGIDTLSSNSGSRTFAKTESLEQHNISFVFNQDSTYHINELRDSYRYTDDSILEFHKINDVIAEGHWTISQTGNEIILDNGIFPNQYIDLINVTENSITIGNFQLFDRPSNEGLNIQLYFKAILTNGG